MQILVSNLHSDVSIRAFCTEDQTIIAIVDGFSISHFNYKTKFNKNAFVTEVGTMTYRIII